MTNTKSATRNTDRNRKLSAALFSSGNDEWETPADLFASLDSEFHFTLDVCALPGNNKCPRYFTPEQDGLQQCWDGVCWCNPPYSRVEKWMKKALEQSQRGTTVVCLVPVRSDTAWWHQYAARGEVRLLLGRLKFGKSKNSAPFPSALVIFRPPAGAAQLASNAAVALVDNLAALVRNAVCAGTDAATSADTEHTTVSPQAQLTTEQRKFVAERSVKLLVQVNKGEVTPEAAMREAEKLPERKGRKSIAGPR